MTSHTDIYRLIHRKPTKIDNGLGDVHFESEPSLNNTNNENGEKSYDFKTKNKKSNQD